MELNTKQKLAVIDAITQFSPKVMYEMDRDELFDEDQFSETCDAIDEFVAQCKLVLEAHV